MIPPLLSDCGHCAQAVFAGLTAGSSGFDPLVALFSGVATDASILLDGGGNPIASADTLFGLFSPRLPAGWNSHGWDRSWKLQRRPVHEPSVAVPAEICYAWLTMSAINGDKARFQRERKHKVAKREPNRALRRN
jgi:hypothetical protein